MVIDVTGLEGTNLETVDAIARAALLVRRCGAEARVVGVGLGLGGLLRLCGLAEALGLEAERQPEHREEAGGVEEEGDPGDLRTVRLQDLE